MFKAKITSKFQQPKFKYGHRVPSNHDEATLLDRQAGNNLWQTSEEVEIKSLSEYNVFRDLGKDGIPPSDHKKIQCHIIYDIKHDGRHKSCSGRWPPDTATNRKY
jgi:hypothetical protein